jgi:membrane-associated phospholipid phosphatase
VDLSSGIRPADRLVSACSLAFGALWLGALGRDAFAPWIATAHAAAACVPLLFTRLRPNASGVTIALRELYPMVFVVFVWTEMGLIREMFHATANDAVIAAADQLLFGRHLHAVWMPAMPHRWFSESMFVVYLAYYPIVFLTPVVLLLRRRRDALRAVTFGLAAGYLTCYGVYALFPVDGPVHTMGRFVGPLTEGLFYRISVSAVHAGDSLGTAFPSSHVVGAVSLAILGARWLSRPVALVFGLEAAGVVLATVYTQNHFAIDAAVGLCVAAVVQLVVVPFLDAALDGRPAGPALPPLPQFPPTPVPIGRGGQP